ncbi:MAG TPA: hypothetical protein VL282_07675 [Tepidisphaeraceae bacterium]|jgi:hypothetical protein|nr:hypothetical protein [Tepidisphaeraceae bacterium]
MRRVASLAVVALVALILSPALLSAAPPAAPTAPAPAANRASPDVNFAGVPLADAIEFIRDVTQANIHVNWRALEEAGVGKDTMVNIRLRSVPLRTVLRLMLNEAGGGTALTYYVSDGVIEITTQELADKELITRVYPIDDLIMDFPDPVPPEFNIQGTAQVSGKGGGGGGSSGQGILSGNTGNTNDTQNHASQKERAEDLIKIIQDSIQPNVWKENGGLATIHFFKGSLIVTAPRSVHQALAG